MKMLKVILPIFVFLIAPFTGGATEWVKLASIPEDILGRELSPGMGGAWCYVPEMKGFLLYGGYSPRYSNEGWLFDPAKAEMKLLWPDDSLGYDPNSGKWRVLLPRGIHWSQNRPGAARGRAAVYSPKTEMVYLFGGHPDSGRDWWGDTKLGTWEFDPTTLKFEHLGDTGPKGIVKAVYDSVNDLIVVAPQRPRRKNDPSPTWVFSPGRRQWEMRAPAGPRPGPYPALAFDSKAGKCVYFSAYGETWTYDAMKRVWENMSPEKAPAPRWHAAMAFVPKLSGTVLHGGVANREDDNPWDSVKAFRTKEGLQYGDTWIYDADLNKWRELTAAGGPGKASSARDLCAVDSENGTLVIYDPALGIWALSKPNAYKAVPQAPTTIISKALLESASRRSRNAPTLDATALAWQENIRSIPDDSWLDPEVKKPVQGCLSYAYNSQAEVIYWVGGCGRVHFGTPDDYKYNNQVFLFDMQVGKWFQRRANHPWMPDHAKAICPGNGCGRAFCMDAKRNVIWTLGGVTGFCLPGTHSMQSYDFRTDRFTVGLEGGPGGSDCGMVYDAGNDLVVLVRGAYHPLETMVFDPEKKIWRQGANHPVKFSQYTRVVYDPKIGVILVGPVPRDWKLGTPLPGKWRQWRDRPKVVRAYAYHSLADQWRDLNPAGADKIPAEKTTGIGVAYDPLRRLIYYVVSNTAGEYGAPRKAMNVAVLDLESNRWLPGKDSPPLPAMNKGSAICDSRRNVVVLACGSRLHLYRWKGGCPKDAFETN